MESGFDSDICSWSRKDTSPPQKLPNAEDSFSLFFLGFHTLPEVPSSLSLLLFAAWLPTWNKQYMLAVQQAEDLGSYSLWVQTPRNPLGSWTTQCQVPLLPPLVWDQPAHAQAHGAQHSPPSSQGTDKSIRSTAADGPWQLGWPLTSRKWQSPEPTTASSRGKRDGWFNESAIADGCQEVFPKLSHPWSETLSEFLASKGLSKPKDMS